MSEQLPAAEQASAERKEIDPWAEVAANFAEDEVAVLVDAAARRVKERGNDPTYWQRASRILKRHTGATALAFTLVAAKEGMMPKPTEAGDGWRRVARAGSVITRSGEEALKDAYYMDVENIRDMESAWRQAEADIEDYTRVYEELAQTIQQNDARVDRYTREGNTAALRDAMERGERLRSKQDSIRGRVRRAQAFQRALERRLPALEKLAQKERIGGALFGLASEVLHDLSRPKY